LWPVQPEVTRILVWPADDGACGHLRLFWPAQLANAVGADVRVLEGDLPVVRGPGGRIREVPVDCDVLVLQRPSGEVMLEVIRAVQAQGVKVVVDMDDDLERVDRANVAWGSVHPLSSPTANWRHAKAACAAADLVTVTTPQLATRYGKRTVVIPNCLPAGFCGRPRGTGMTVGWPGLAGTHPNDLQVTRGNVAGVVAATPGASFLQVGPGDAAGPLGFKARSDATVSPLFSSTGMLDLTGYFAALSRIDVTIVPLADTAFNLSKSGLKAIEAAGSGSVPVMSPTPDNLRLHEEGLGLIARRPRDWHRHLKRLLLDLDYRQELAAAGSEVAARWTIEGNVHRWLDAWTSA